MLNFLFVIGAMWGIALFGFIISYIKNDVVRWTVLAFGSTIGFFGFLLTLISMTA